MKKLLFCAVLCAVFLWLIWPTNASPAKCSKYDDMVNWLKTVHRERMTASGISPDSKKVFEVFKSEDGTWSIIMVSLNGSACLMAAGHSWRDIPKNPNDLKPLGKPT